MNTKKRLGHRRLSRLAAGLLGLLLLAAVWQARGLSLPWPGRAQAATPAALPRAQLVGYEATVQRRAVAGIADNLSGLTFNPHTGTLFGVVNRPPSLVELSTEGQLLRNLSLRGIGDPEGIAHIRDDWFAIADERRNRIHWLQIAPGQNEVQAHSGPSLALAPVQLKNFGLEGLGWDRQRQQLVAVTEKWPQQVLSMDGPLLSPGPRQLDMPVQAWQAQDAAGVPSTDLASVEIDPRSGHLLLLGEESSVLYEYTRAGELLGVMPLWAGMSGLAERIGQPEGVAMDDAGTLYIVSEPNLFYRFDKRRG